MQRSLRTTDRGFTLLEVVVGSAIFATVLVIALSLVNESTDAAKLATAQSDLRRQGEELLGIIARDLRSTQAPYVTLQQRSGTNARGLELFLIRDFDPVTRTPILDGNAAGFDLVTGPPASTTRVLRWTAPSGVTTNGGRNAVLFFERGTVGEFALQRQLRVPRCLELARDQDAAWPYGGTAPSGFSVTIDQPQGLSLPNLLSTGAYSSSNHLPDQPISLRLRLVLKRRIGHDKNVPPPRGPEIFAWASVEARVELRPTQSY